MKHYDVTAAILVNNNEILCVQRGMSKYDYISYKYEFPGGKVESGESMEECLQREIREELSIEIEVKPKDHFLTVEYKYPDFSISMHSYICPTASREIVRKEHTKEVWLRIEELKTLDWAAADIPIVDKLMETLK